MFIEKWFKRLRVWRVSSDAIKSTSAKISSALWLISLRFPVILWVRVEPPPGVDGWGPIIRI